MDIPIFEMKLFKIYENISYRFKKNRWHLITIEVIIISYMWNIFFAANQKG